MRLQRATMRAMPGPSVPVPPETIETPRLVLRASDPAMSRDVLAFVARNQAHFAPWDPPTPEVFFTVRGQRERLLKSRRAFAIGDAFRYWLTTRNEPSRIVGQAHVFAVSRGAFHSAMLGYQLDQQLQGGGLMHEALHALVATMFADPVRLHRLQAAHLPENLKSAAVLARLGFKPEGLAEHYLYINGQWRDHVINALLNPEFGGAPPV
jgi:ribosomal-protein-alanine N-acetyltransferase